MRANIVSRTVLVVAASLTLIDVANPQETTIGSIKSPPRGESRPNILFVFTDDHAPHAIGAYGSKINETPNIDRLAREGVVFDRAYCGNSICAPSRATILTGKHSHMNGVVDNRDTFDGDQLTFPKLLRRAGYTTAVIGKWHLKSDPTGFDHWEVLRGQGPYWNPPLKTAAGTVKHTGYTTDIITDRALKWLKEDRDDKLPFLLMFQHKAPHREWQPGPKHFNKYDDVTIPEPPHLFDDWAGRASGAAKQTMTIANHMSRRDLKLTPPPGLTPDQLAMWHAAYDSKNEAFHKADLTGKALVRWRYQRYVKDYLRCIASVDDNLGRVLDYLDASGLAKNTIVVYSSDQGFYLGDHGWYDKRWMYEESYRMPLIVRWPGRAIAGSRDGHLVQNIDYAQTFLDAAGAKAPADMQGKSLVPLIAGKDVPWRSSLYYHYWEFPGAHSVRRHRGVSTQRYKLIHYYRINEWELFDLEQDPREMKSVHGDPAYAKTQASLEKELQRLREHYGDVDPDLDDQPRHNPIGSAAPPRPRRVKLEQVLDVKTALAEHPNKLDCANKPMTVGVRCTPTAANGIAIAQGGEVAGWSLGVENGKPFFCVRAGGQMRRVSAPDAIALNSLHTLAGVLAPNGKLHLWVDGTKVATADGHFIPKTPAEGLDIGGDSGSRVDGGVWPPAFVGELRDIRVYWGRLPDRRIKKW